ncbi:MAG: hypothetical protein WKF31_01385 [Thermoleophilaceae bacterium]
MIERDGVPRYRRLSTYANVASILARLNRESAMRDLIQHGLPSGGGPARCWPRPPTRTCSWPAR